MCGRISLYSTPERLARIFDAELGRDLDPSGLPSWNVPPTSPVLGIAAVEEVRGAADQHGDGLHRELGSYRWGLVPPGARDPSIAHRLFNARAETVASKPSFRTAFAARRLAVVADGFYEWRARPGAARRPYYFSRSDGRPLALAGLWEPWWGGGGERGRDGPGGPALRTCTIITAEAGADMDGIHDRMPVVLGPADLDEWLDPCNRDRPALRSLLAATVPGTLVHHPVDARVGNVRNDGPELIEPVDLQG